MNNKMLNCFWFMALYFNDMLASFQTVNNFSDLKQNDGSDSLSIQQCPSMFCFLDSNVQLFSYCQQKLPTRWYLSRRSPLAVWIIATRFCLVMLTGCYVDCKSFKTLLLHNGVTTTHSFLRQFIDSPERTMNLWYNNDQQRTKDLSSFLIEWQQLI